MLPATGVLMAGGQSKRMGQDKAFLQGRKKPMIEEALEVLESLFPEIILSGADPRLTAYGYAALPDSIPGKGPLGGLCTVLQAAQNDFVFLVSCDLPLFRAEPVRYLWECKKNGTMAVIPVVEGKRHPLHAFYHKSLLPLLQAGLRQEKLKLAALVETANIQMVDLPQELVSAVVTNVNTPEEWEKIQQIVKMDRIKEEIRGKDRV